ncbi:MAG: sensor histidine kinase [Agathobacter sp.]
MAIKWKNIKAGFLFLLIAEIILIVYILAHAMRTYHLVATVMAFVIAGVLLVLMAWFLADAIDEKNSGITDDEYHRKFLNARLISWAGVAAYVIGLTVILVIPRTNNFSYTYNYMQELRYDLAWIKYALYLVPTITFEFTFFVRSFCVENQRIRSNIKVAVAERVKSENLKIDLITNVAHDLKTPLTSIIGYLALMEKEELSPVLSDYLTSAMRKAELLKDMIEKVFDLSKASSGNTELHLDRISMNKLAQQVTADVSDTYADKQKVIKMQLTEENTDFMADNTYAYRIVQNLIVNAVKYSLDGTRIYINTFVKDGRIYFSICNVSNYPLDVEPSVLKERFVRGDKSRSTEGNGLGLAIVETYTNALGGHFNIATIGDMFQATLDFQKC